MEDFDVGPLTWVKDEIDLALKNVLDSLSALETKPDDTAKLRFSQTHLYQVSGALDMVGLEGCKRFCAAMESLANKLEKQVIPVTPEVLALVREAVSQLDQYLKELLNGAPDQPLKLFPALQSLLAVQGESADESELFFPDTSLRAPKSESVDEIAEADIPDYVIQQRSLFQKSLLGWLRTKSEEGLQGMLTALSNVQQVKQQQAQKTLWWSAAAFVETLTQDKIAEKRNVMKLCRRLDQQLRAFGRGTNRASGTLLRDMLFYVAISDASTERIGQVKQLFELEDLLPGHEAAATATVEIQAGELETAAQLADAMDALKDLWSAVSEAKPGALAEFVIKSAEMAVASQALTQPYVHPMFTAIESYSRALEGGTRQITEHAVIEVAAGLNVLEDALRSYQTIARETSQQLLSQAQRINSILHGEESIVPAGAVADEGLGQDVLPAMIAQIKAALKVTEQSLDTFFRNPAQHEILESVFKPLQQVAAAFDMLNMPLPTDIAKSSLALVEYFHAVPGAAEQAQFELVAESLSMLDLFVDELPRTRPESEATLASASSRLQSQLDTLAISGEPASAEPAATSATTEESAAIVANESSPSITDSAADAELLDIYLTEAEEVLATVAQNLQALRINATDPEALVEVRRGYHTLKGSGRAVGLNTVGEVAWTVEKLLNNVMEQKLTPSADMIGFTEDVTAAFAGWVAELRNGAAVDVDLPGWQEKATALQASIAKRKPRAVEEVVIGGTHKISRALFNIFMAEAQEHMQALTLSVPNVLAAAASGDILKPDDDSRRAAHTLASNAGTAGFKAICNLSRALEHWLDAHQGNWTETSAALYENVVKALGNMLEKAALLRQPKQVSALLAALKESTLNARAVSGVEEVAESEALPAAEMEADNTAQAADQADADSVATVDTAPSLEETDVATEHESAQEPSTGDLEADSEDIPVSITPPAEIVSIKNAIKQAAKPDTADNELLSMFIEEARELVPTVGNELRAWRLDPFESEHPDELQRALHTLKGSARMAGQSALADTVHDMEDRVMRGLKTKSKEIDFDGLFQNLDEIGGQLEEAVNLVSMDGQPEEKKPGRTVERTQYLRMRAEVLDRLINEAGEISIARSRMEREMQGFKQFSLDLTESVFRLRNQLREMEIEAESQLQSRMAFLQETNETFDPLEFDRFTRLQELTRMMAESVNDVSTIQHGLLMNLDETESALQQQNRMNRELQHGLMNVRMVPFSMIAERLQRIIRQTSRELNKAVEMSIDGENVDIDRSVLDKIVAPLEHLLRNSVAHGMETRAERKKAKKSETGSVALKVRRENDEIIITVADDGAGINLAKVKKKAIENGLFEKGQKISDQALLQVIFESGFSTATTVTQIAGRGVGLDSVRTDITALGGRIDVSNSAGQGAVFNIYLPVTLSVAQVVVVRAGTNVFALPSVMVEQVQNLKPAELAAGYEAQHITWSGREYPLLYLNRLVGHGEHAPEAQLYSPLLLLRSGTYQIALHVDEILGNQEVVMKPIGPQLAHVPGMIGATVMGDGNVVLILNAVQLANREELAAGTVKVSSAPAIEAIAEVETTTVLVVDDSLTMRKVLGRLLEREGYRVIVAKDGMDALQLLQELTPDIILSDIEMPRMDGFELLRNIRGDARISDIPVIIISSRTAEKHRQLAQELGVNAFLGKPVQDDDLITQISVLLGRADPIAAAPD